MQWEGEFKKVVLKKRYKRFLADILIQDKIEVAHVPNTGSMTSCWEEDWVCLVTESNNPARKLKYTLELTHNGVSWIGVNTANANKLVKEWLTSEILSPFIGYQKITPEKKVGASRFDFFLEGHQTLPDCYIEVKNVTLKLDGLAQFPDAVSERGQKHLRELVDLKKAGYRTCMVYVVQREDVDSFKAAQTIDPQYARLLQEANQSGVEVYVYQCRLTEKGIEWKKEIPWRP